MSLDILFLGGTSIDFIQDKTGKLAMPRFIASTGGSITNSAVIIAKLGLKAAVVSRIGKDPLGDFAVGFLNSSGVTTKGIVQDPNIRTPIAIASIDKSGNSKYTFYKNTSKDAIVCFRDAPMDLLKRCKILHFGSSFSYQEDTSPEALKYLRFLKKRGVFISFDPNFRPYNIKDRIGAKNRVLGLLKWADLAKLSEIDLGYLAGATSNKKGLRILKNRFKCRVILTLGKRGSAYLDSKDNLIKVPAFKVKIADTIGAGDAFTAGLLYKLSRVGERTFFGDIRRHLKFASAVSAIICTKRGANQALKGVAEVNSLLYKRG